MFSPPNDAPVNKLPNELMLIIFSMAFHGSTREALPLMRVSRRWRELARICRDLWTEIRFLPWNVELTRVCLERSGNKPLTISVLEKQSPSISQSEKQQRFETFIQLILPHNHHWRSLSVEYNSPYDDYGGKEPSSPSFQELARSLMKGFCSNSLEVLEILPNDRETLKDPVYDFSFWDTVLSERAYRFPKLRSLTLYDFIPTLGPTLAPAIQTLTELHLDLYDVCTGIHLLEIALFLQNLPSLQNLTLKIQRQALKDDENMPIPIPNLAYLDLKVWSSADAHITDFCKSLNVCEFPYLRSMTLTFEVEIFLSRWTMNLFEKPDVFPSLENLTLTMEIKHDDQEDQVLQVIVIPLENTPSLETLDISIAVDIRPIEVVLGRGISGIAHPEVRFPALRHLKLHTNREMEDAFNLDPHPKREEVEPNSSILAKKCITDVVKEIKSRGTWESFERLEVTLRRSEICALKNSLDPGGEDQMEKVGLSRKEIEKWLKAELA